MKKKSAALDGDTDFDPVVEQEEARRFQALVDEVNDLVAKHCPVSLLKGPVDLATPIVPPFPPEPDLHALTAEEMIQRVVAECATGDVILVGRKTPGSREAKPYAALAVAEQRSETVRRLQTIFETITASGSVAYWKLNPYRRDLIEAHAGVKIADTWNGEPLKLKIGTWVDDHIAWIAFLSGDHDIGRDEKDAKLWENAIPFDDGVAQYWFKIQMLGAGPMLTLFQRSGRGFSPIWQVDPPVAYNEEVKQEFKAVLSTLLDRARGLAVDEGIYKTVNPFIKAPGAVHPATERVVTYFVVGDSELYNVDDFNAYFEQYRRWWSERRQQSEYPDDPVQRKRRKVSEGSKAAYRQRLGPSYATVRDLLRLVEYWDYDLSGRSNAFFRCYAWHRRNILWTEVGVEAKRNREQLTEEVYVHRVYEQLRIDMEGLNDRTGNRIDGQKMNGYLSAKFPKKPKPTSDWAAELGVTTAIVHDLNLQTIIPAEERKVRDEASEGAKARRQRSKDLKNKALDEMIMSGEPYDYSRFTKEQVKYRLRKLKQVGKQVPERKRGRRRSN